MSSFKKAIPQKQYRERSQPEERKKLGVLEKHTDYQVRSRKQHQKEEKIKLLREKIQNKNPDEYYIDMSHAQKTSSGITKIKKITATKTTKKDQKLQMERMAHVNLNLLKYKHSMKLKKIDKLKHQLSFSGHSENNHTIFVDDEEELEEFSGEKYFDTNAQLGGQVHNRPRQKTLLQKMSVASKEIDPTRSYKKLLNAIDDEKVIRGAIDDLELNQMLILNNKDVETLIEDKLHKNPNLHHEFQNVIGIKLKSERRK
jgi:U3 small nucleolar RNA-associated protein 11